MRSRELKRWEKSIKIYYHYHCQLFLIPNGIIWKMLKIPAKSYICAVKKCYQCLKTPSFVQHLHPSIFIIIVSAIHIVNQVKRDKVDNDVSCLQKNYAKVMWSNFIYPAMRYETCTDFCLISFSSSWLANIKKENEM